ncbi:MAG: Glycosyl transferase, group 1 [Candidatus Saccharibacteria bacterium GW2011_GWA2_46_10]|nr:MAG: Glycosyl transferase, group 1 [Candidatus Saccharibacteria bacterium GW2011_GWA2_46_10]
MSAQSQKLKAKSINAAAKDYGLRTRDLSDLKVAIVCDWLIGTGGAERVVVELHRLYPDAPIYTSQYDGRLKKWFGDTWFENAEIRTLWTQKLPKVLRKFMPPLRALAFSRLNLSEFDLVISSSGAEAKFVKVKDGAVHITYCHAPTHYYWARYEQYLKQPGFGWFNPLARLGLKLLVGPMRRLDLKAASRPDYFVANSNYTQEQIKKYYGRDSVVIHPPVDIERFAKHNLPADKRHGYVTAGRQTPYKRIDLAVKAATKINLPLLVIGRGPEHKKLKRLAGRNVTFLRQTTDEKMAEHFGSAKGFIFPGIDDFGIVAVEALAAGTPVLAYGEGGALGYVDKSSGMVFNRPSADNLASALDNFDKMSFDHQKIAENAKRFSATRFRAEMMKFLNNIRQ